MVVGVSAPGVLDECVYALGSEVLCVCVCVRARVHADVFIFDLD